MITLFASNSRYQEIDNKRGNHKRGYCDEVLRVIDAEAVDRRSEKITQATDANERKNEQGREVTYKGQQDKYDQIGKRRCDQRHVQQKIQTGYCREE